MANPCNIGKGQSAMKRLLQYSRTPIYWTSEEQSVLEYLLEKYASEISIVRYENIAQALTDKSIRDVTMRCRWTRAMKNGKMKDISKTEIPRISINDGNIGRLMERTTRTLNQIEANISDLKVDGSIELFCEARASILATINDLGEMDTPFPYKLNEELGNSILPPP